MISLWGRCTGTAGRQFCWKTARVSKNICWIFIYLLFFFLLLVEIVQEAKQLQWLVRAVCCAINTEDVLSFGDQTAQCKAETSSYPKTQLQFRNHMLGLVLVLLFLLRHFWASHGILLFAPAISHQILFTDTAAQHRQM